MGKCPSEFCQNKTIPQQSQRVCSKAKITANISWRYIAIGKLPKKKVQGRDELNNSSRVVGLLAAFLAFFGLAFDDWK
jgi:hypothetical protein